MRVFVSSLIGGFEAERGAVLSAITTLRHEPVMAEDFGAQPNSPQVACMQGLRSADLVILVLGERYGTPQASGLSATHEEYREAQGTKPIIAFVQAGLDPEPAQVAFIEEVQGWEGGLFRESFTDPGNLATLVTRALHDFELTSARTPVDGQDLQRIAADGMPVQERGYYTTGGPFLCASFGMGPRQQILRAARIEDQEFADDLQQMAQFGQPRLFDASGSTARAIENDALLLSQDSGSRLRLNEGGDLLLQVTLGSRDRQSRMSGLPAIIEEDVTTALKACLQFANDVLEKIDATQRLSHLGVAVGIRGGEGSGWRTRAEHRANSSSMEVPMFGSRDREPVTTDFPRPALRLNRNGISEDIVVRLRRQWHCR
jgi:hypothetical protein